MIDGKNSTNLYAQCGSGEATVEHVNSVGGIERTNIPFIFQWAKYGISSSTNYDLECLPDVRKIMAQQEAEFQEQLKNIGK
jgi:hypothetical protein